MKPDLVTKKGVTIPFLFFQATLSCVKVTHFVYSQIPKNASLLGIFPDFSENFQKSSKIINLNIREQFQKDVFTSGTDRLKSR